MYMPTLARFTSRDPLAEQGIPILGGLPEEVPTAGPTLKPYVYVSNDPINALDPSGLWELRCRFLSGIKKATIQQHCWISCGGFNYSLLNNAGSAKPSIDDARDKPDPKNKDIVASGTGGCECIRLMFQLNDGTYSYDKDQCNSNYFASKLLSCCGFSVKRPKLAYGWGDCNRQEGMFDCYREISDPNPQCKLA